MFVAHFQLRGIAWAVLEDLSQGSGVLATVGQGIDSFADGRLRRIFRIIPATSNRWDPPRDRMHIPAGTNPQRISRNDGGQRSEDLIKADRQFSPRVPEQTLRYAGGGA